LSGGKLKTVIASFFSSWKQADRQTKGYFRNLCIQGLIAQYQYFSADEHHVMKVQSF
jgi:hypothetical protein